MIMEIVFAVGVLAVAVVLVGFGYVCGMYRAVGDEIRFHKRQREKYNRPPEDANLDDFAP